MITSPMPYTGRTGAQRVAAAYLQHKRADRAQRAARRTSGALCAMLALCACLTSMLAGAALGAMNAGAAWYGYAVPFTLGTLTLALTAASVLLAWEATR